ncbi:SAV_2336 N-terminal domain-related protein [Streptomyces sp. NPDC059009]|uniref:SAV_2336 N-terminal domain-related protein n=1 Tax=Streptomyces sp. NPDC059009 TaxID=3346694 RepID=UPI00367D7E10
MIGAEPPSRPERAGSVSGHRLRAVLDTLTASGVGLSGEELLDALWLAGRMPTGGDAPLARAGGIVPAPAASGPATHQPGAFLPDRPQLPSLPPQFEPTGRPAAPQQHQPHPTSPAADAPDPRARTSPGPIPLYGAARPHPSGRTPGQRPQPLPARPVRAPATKALGARQLQLGRSLRPLKHRVPDRARWELDEDATAESTAESGLTDAVLRPARARWLDLALLVDDGASMLLWQRLATEVRLLVERSGAFRTVRVHGLDTRGPAAPLLGHRPYTPGTAVLPPSTVTDPSGHTLILVVSDGVGAAWRDGRMREWLKQWGRYGPTAVLHALPGHLWDGSGIRAERWRVTTRRRGAPNATWDVVDPVLPPEVAPFDGMPVPVLAPEPEAVGAWAALVASPGASAVLPLLARQPGPGPAGEPAPVSAATPAPAAAGEPPQDRDAASRSVLRFRDAASPEAYRLAAHLAAVAPLSVPVMRLVQGALGDEVTTGHLAEVFLGGLMRRTASESAELPPHHRSYDFTDGARAILLSTAPAPELLRTSRRVTERLGELAGRSPDFPAWLAHPAGTERVDGDALPFGWVDDRLLRRLGVSTAPARTEPAPEYVGAPRSEWLPLSSYGLHRVGPWHLFARHLTADGDSGLFLGRDGRGRTAAVRVAPPGTPQQLILRGEADVLRHLDGRGAPRILGVDAEGAPPWLATEPAMAGSPAAPAPHLVDHTRQFGRLERTEFARLGHQVASTLALAHAAGLTHGRLIPERVLMTPHGAVLAGWGGHGSPLGATQDLHALGETLLGAAGEDVPTALLDLLRRCVRGLPHNKPSAAEVADGFGEFVTGIRVAAPARGPLTDLVARIGYDETGAEVLLDLAEAGQHGGITGPADESAALLESVVDGLVRRYAPQDLQIYLASDDVLAAVPPGATAGVPHIVRGPGGPRWPETLLPELRRRQGLAGEAPWSRRPSDPVLVVLCSGLRTPVLHGAGWDDALSGELGVHVLALGRPLTMADGEYTVAYRTYRIRLGSGHDLSTFHHRGAPPSGTFFHRARRPTHPLGGGSPFPPGPPPPIPSSERLSLARQFRAAVDRGRAGHLADAHAALDTVIAEQAQLLGQDDPDTLASIYELGFVLLGLGRTDEAYNVFDVTATSRDRALGPRHTDSLLAHQQRAFVRGLQGRHMEAEEIYRGLLTAWEKSPGALHPHTLLCRHNLAATLINLGRHEKAAAEARTAYAGRSLTLGPEHPDTLSSGHELAVALRELPSRSVFRAVAEEVHEARKRTLGAHHADTLATKALLDPPPPSSSKRGPLDKG